MMMHAEIEPDTLTFNIFAKFLRVQLKDYMRHVVSTELRYAAYTEGDSKATLTALKLLSLEAEERTKDPITTSGMRDRGTGSNVEPDAHIDWTGLNCCWRRWLIILGSGFLRRGQ
mmetsp:Transcript_43749/g.68489  ORF Transcript_43749/g.68489 Transcript_43749/m.68489 type:complete len:115 (+) Transcript_43749:176-520(+)